MEYCRSLTCTRVMQKTPKKTVVICGATGVIGSALVKYFLENGDRVIAVGRNQAKLDALNEAQWKGKAACVEGQLTNETAAQQLRDDVLQVTTVSGGNIDQVVASLGALSMGKSATQLSIEQVAEVMTDFTAHFLCAKMFLPILNQRAGSYIFTTGIAGETCFVPELALTTIKNAAQFGLCQSLISEFKQGPARFYELRIGMLVVEEDKEDLSPQASSFGPAHGAHRFGRLYSSILNSGQPPQVIVVKNLKDVEEYCPHAAK